METGLYGQQERGEHFASRANENRNDDVLSEGTHEGIITEAEYRQKMALCVRDEVLAARKERELEEECRNALDIVADVVFRAIGMSIDQQKQAMQRLGIIAENMRSDGFHITRVYIAISASFPIALTMMWNEKAKPEQGDKPESKIGRFAKPYNPELAEMLLGAKKKKKK